ncbi:uncharacterized protein akna [Neosynchiropus ocellatus]
MSTGTRTKMTTGVLFWTPAPVCSSPTSSVGSEEEWEHDDDFDTQMDDSGIIGLTDAVGAAQLEDLQDQLALKCERDFLRPEESEPGVTDEPTEVVFLERTDDCQESVVNNEDKNLAENLGPHLPATRRHLPTGRSHLDPLGGPAAQQCDNDSCPDAELTETFADTAMLFAANHCNISSHLGSKKLPEHPTVISDKAVPSRSPHRPTPQSPLSTSCPAIISTSKPHESRKGSLRKPNLSKVEPRVRFPKGDYKPPKSRLSCGKKSLSPQPLLERKSPADFAREKSVVKGPDQATTLLEQLQEDYNNLLIKYAEAENTIDRLRLEAKVGLNYKFPAPIQSVESQATNETSKFLSLCFPQAQRADDAHHSVSHCHQQGAGSPGSSPATAAQSHPSQLGRELSDILCAQADKFLQQLQVFDDLLKKKKLNAVDQISGFSRLHHGLNSLERSYLTAKNHEKSLQQTGEPVSHFDPDRELEELILECGRHMDELKKQVEQATPSLATFEDTTPLERRVMRPASRAENRPETFHLDPVESTPESASSDDDEFRLQSIYLKLPNGYDDDEDVNTQSHNSQNQEGEAHSSAAVQAEIEFGREGNEVVRCSAHRDAESRRSGSVHPSAENSAGSDFKHEDDKQQAGRVKMDSETQSRIEFDPLDSAHASSAKPLTRKRTSPLLEDSTSPSNYPLDGCRKTEAFESSCCRVHMAASLSPKTQCRIRKAHSQPDGVISPETDSGFVGSDSSRLNLAAGAAVHHQRVPKRGAAVHVEVDSPGTQTGSAPGLPPRSSSSSRTRSSTAGSGKARRTETPMSPLQWVKKTGVQSDSSEFEMESDQSPSLSADGPSDRFPEHLLLACVSSQSSTSVTQHRHGDALKAVSCRQVEDCKDVVHNLQAEVDRLRDKIKSSLKQTGPFTAAMSDPVKTSTPHQRSKPRWSESSGEGARFERDKAKRKTPRKHMTTTRSRSSTRREQRHHIMSSSEQELSTRTRQVSRFTQTGAPGPPASPTLTVCSSSQTPRQDPGASAEDLGRRKGQAPPCPHCSCRLSSCFQCGGGREPACATSGHCPHCGQHSKSTKTDGHPSSGQSRPRPAGSQDKERHTQAPPFVQCVPVCSPSVLLYPNLQPIFMSPGSRGDAPAGVKVHHKNQSVQRPPSPGEQSFLVDSLDRAVRAAQKMKRRSRHIVRSLALDLQHQDLLAHSCAF